MSEGGGCAKRLTGYALNLKKSRKTGHWKGKIAASVPMSLKGGFMYSHDGWLLPSYIQVNICHRKQINRILCRLVMELPDVGTVARASAACM